MISLRLTPGRPVFEGTPQPTPNRNLALASLVSCPDGSVLLAHRAGTTKNSGDGVQHLYRSRDSGFTWERCTFPFSLTLPGGSIEHRTVAFSRIGPEQIALLLTWIEHPAGDPPLLNPKTEGLLPIHIGWASSTDSGATWSELREIDPKPLVQPCGNGPIVRLPDGRLLVAFETYKKYDDPSPWTARSVIMTSSNEGRSWDAPQILAVDSRGSRNYWDQHVYVLQDGSLLNLLWSEDRNSPLGSGVFQMRSRDSGKTWTEPTDTGIAGQYSSLVELRSGHLLLFYVVRTGDPSIRVKISTDHGQSWETTDCLVHSQNRDDLARVGGQSYTEHLRNMGNWSFGWPCAIQLPNEQVLVSYYLGEGDQSSVMLARIDVG